jgi:LmbE family N-acetylglucosaminyl deacetylase
MEVDKIMIVAHPDDEMLWGGGNVLSQPGWFVVCATNASTMDPSKYKFPPTTPINPPQRSEEFYATMSNANVTCCKMYDIPDDPSAFEDRTNPPNEDGDYPEISEAEQEKLTDTLFDGSEFEKDLEFYATKNWNVIMTHNSEGEYGHAHHKKVHKMVMKIFDRQKDRITTFGDADGTKLHSYYLEEKRKSLMYYTSQSICGKIFNNEKIKPDEKSSFENEPLVVGRIKTIPKLIHQIWFGSPPSGIRKVLFENNEKIARSKGFEYKLWKQDDFNAFELTVTWGGIQKALMAGKEFMEKAGITSPNNIRMAQVADLARYELLHKFGGVYLDSIFEIREEFCDYIEQNSNRELIVCNEDPCGLDCNSNGHGYLSNGFFACVPGCKALHGLIDFHTLNEIVFENPNINKTTGPYYFRSGIYDGQLDVLIMPTHKMYPYWIADTAYRKKDLASQCSDVAQGTINLGCFKTEFPDSLAIYHHGFGGTWGGFDPDDYPEWKGLYGTERPPAPA